MEKEKVLFNATLVFVENTEGKVLLGVKARKIGVGCWNGYGGGIEPNETPEQSALRELDEESGIKGDPSQLEKCGVVIFNNTKEDGKEFVCKMHVYFLRNTTAEVSTTEEMLTPKWFDKNELPYNNMMPADKDWVPYVMRGEKIQAEAWYGPFQKTLLKPTEIQVVKELHL